MKLHYISNSKSSVPALSMVLINIVLVSSLCLVGLQYILALETEIEPGAVIVCEYEEGHSVVDLWDPKPCQTYENADKITCCVDGESGPNICCSFFDYPGVWMWMIIGIVAVIAIGVVLCCLRCLCCCC